MKILFSNLGYARGINGSLWHHFSRLGRNFYNATSAQEEVLTQFKAILAKEQPDLCCLVEIDRGSFQTAYYNQIQALIEPDYGFYDIADKYGDGNPIGRLPMHKGKSNAFLSRTEIPFEKLYFTHGSKRLIYRLNLPNDLTVFFAHFSLNQKVRLRQFHEVRRIMESVGHDVMILADFNIMNGFSELDPLLNGSDLIVLNDEDEHTFQFHKRRLALDLCICSASLKDRAKLDVIHQPFSDHAALLVEI